MKKNSTITVIICGLAAIFATVVFYFLAFDNIFTIPMRWLSLTVLLITEIIGTVNALTVGRNIFGVTQIITGALHLLATLVLSIVFVNLFPLLIKEYLLLTLLMLIVVTVVDILLLYFAGKSRAVTQKYMESATTIDECEAKAKLLLIENKGTVFASQLKAIVEMLTYANRGMTGMNDYELLGRIEEIATLISDNEEDKALQAIKQVQNILKYRIETTKKTGSF